MIAASASKVSTITLLVNFGAPINQASSISGQTALFSATNTGDEESVQTLINLGANVNFQTSDGNTPLKTAANGNRTNIVEILKAAGAQISNCSHFDYAPKNCGRAVNVAKKNLHAR